MPAWLLLVLGAGAIALVSIVTHFVTSARAKANAAAYKEKVLRMVAIIKKRVENLERTKLAVEAELAAAKESARVAERNAEEAREEADAHRAVAAQERKRADRAEQVLRELEERLGRVAEVLSRWEVESRTAEHLGRIAGSTISVAVVVELFGIVADSPLLSSHRFRPEGALKAIDESIQQAAAACVQEELEVQDLANRLLLSTRYAA